MRRLMFLLVALSLWGQVGIVNVDFEEAGVGGLPVGWTVPETSRHFAVRVLTEGCRHGRGCVEMKPGAETGNRFGVLEQRFEAGQLAGSQVLFSAYLFVEKGAQGALQVKVEDSRGQVIAMRNSVLEPVVGSGKWAVAYLPVDVPSQAAKLALGVLAFGGRVVVDSVSLPVFTPANPVLLPAFEGPSPLSRTALNNLVGYARLFGVIRYLHPSDQAAEADWNALIVAGVRTLDYATKEASLGRRLQELFQRVAPGVRLYVGEPPAIDPALRPAGKQELLRWKYQGFEIGERVLEPVSTWSEADLRVVDLGRGLKALVPLAVFREDGLSLPRLKEATARVAPTVIGDYSGNDRATRLAIVILAWNAFEHFWPQAKLTEADWNDALVRALQRAATDKNGDEFATTLQEMVGRLGAEVSYRTGRESPGLELPGNYRVDWLATDKPQ